MFESDDEIWWAFLVVKGVARYIESLDVDVKQLNEFEMWLTKLGEKLNVLKWMVGGDKKLLAFDCCGFDIALEEFEIGGGVGLIKLVQSKPPSLKIAEWISNWNKNGYKINVDSVFGKTRETRMCHRHALTHVLMHIGFTGLK